MAFISDSSIKEVSARADVVSVIGEYVTLKKAGGRLKGLCPFHNEKTPSFTVNPDRGFFHCFGCGEHGDSIGFLCKHNGLTFVEAVEHLAARAGVQLTYEGGKDGAPRKDPSERERERQRRDRQLQITERTGRWFQESLKKAPGDSPVWQYIAQRGINQETIDTFHLGFAPNEWGSLSDAMRNRPDDSKIAEELGLIVPRKTGQGYYDRFRNRLIFPVFDIAEKVIGFGGRILPSDDPKEGAKYINSPDSPIYTKGDILYGLAQAKRHIRSMGYALLVEGNIDVLTLHQEGFPNTIAPMGTALTGNQVHLLKRFSEEVVLLYDGDDAGRAAALKSLPMLLDEDLHGRVVLLEQGEDPDTFVRDQGADALSKRIEKALPLMEFLIEFVADKHGSTDRGRARALAELQPYYHSIRDFREKELVLTRIASTLNLPERRVQGMLRGASSPANSLPEKTEENRRVRGLFPKREEELTLVCLQYPTCLSLLEDVDGQALVGNDDLRRILWEAITTYGEEGILNPTTLLDRFEDSELRQWVAGAMCSPCEVEEEEAPAWVESCLQLMRGESQKRTSAELAREIETAQRDGDEEKLRELMKRKLALARKRTGVQTD